MMSDVHHIIPPPESHVNINHSTKYLHVKEPSTSPSPSSSPSSPPLSLTARDRCPELNRAIQSVRYIAAFTKEEIENGKAKEDWKFVAMVLDRLFLWIFSVAVVGRQIILFRYHAYFAHYMKINHLPTKHSD